MTPLPIATLTELFFSRGGIACQKYSRIGVPLKLVGLSGSYFEFGVALGWPSFDVFRDVMLQIERVKILCADWFGIDHLRQAEAAVRTAFPDYMRELDGITEGAR